MTMLNEHLELEIKQQFLANDDLSSQRIDVTANGGQITLSGRVQSFRRKLAAQELAAASEHVISVDNQLVVEAPVFKNDISIATDVNRLFDDAVNLTNESVRVRSKTQTVALTGYVNSELEKVFAADLAASVDGVAEVDNFLVVNPEQVLANREHCQKILDSIAGLIGMQNEKIRLSVVNETARLSGVVDAPWKAEIAEEVTGQYGIMNVLNEITVHPVDETIV